MVNFSNYISLNLIDIAKQKLPTRIYDKTISKYCKNANNHLSETFHPVIDDYVNQFVRHEKLTLWYFATSDI